MNESVCCPKCGIQLTADSPAGLCPKCLVQAGFESQPFPQSEPGPTGQTPPTSGFVPPTVEELAPLFPQLEILELLGKGGMGAVYKARQPGLDRLVAVKILPPEISRDPAFTERFQREARALARLSHPHIVAVYDFGVIAQASLCYIVMEFVDGANLRQAIRTGKLTSAEALAIVPQICEALQFAHDEGIVHRDIKPENILIDKRGRVKIADFGLAKLLGQDASDHSLTATHQVMGTLRYMAPEQMQGSREVDHRADIYSLGVVFYELLTGQLPMGKFAPPSKRVQVDVRLDEIVLRALEQDPEQRYQHASDVKTAVEVVSGSLSAQEVAASEIRETEEAVSGGDVLRQSFLVLLSIIGTLSLFMPWTRVMFGQTFPDGGGSFVSLAVHGVYHWFPVFGALLSAALLFVTLQSIGCGKRPLRAMFAIAAGLALASSSIFTIVAQPLTVHPESYSAMVDQMDEWSAHVKGGASALAELVRLSQAADRWTPGTRHVSIHAEPFFGSWAALATGLLLLLLGTIEFRSIVSSSLNRMAVAPLQSAAEPAQALRLTGLLGPAALLIMLLMNMADVFINGGGAGSQPWSLLRTLLIWAFAVHLFHACFITPWILFGANRLRTLSSPGAVRTASILAMLPLNFSAFVGIPAGLWSLLALRGGVTGAESSSPKTLSGQRAKSDKKTETSPDSTGAGTPLTQMRFTVTGSTDVAPQAVFHFSSLDYQLVEQQSNVCVFQRGGQWAGLGETDIRKIATRLTVRTTPAADGQQWVSCDWSVRTLGAWITKGDTRQLEAEGRGLETLLGGRAHPDETETSSASLCQLVQGPADCMLLAAGVAFATACGVAVWLISSSNQFTNSMIRGTLTGMSVALAIYSVLVGVAGLMLRRLRARLLVLLVAVIVGLFFPAVIALNVVMELRHIPVWPVVIPLWLGMPAALWAVVRLFRDDVRRAFDAADRQRAEKMGTDPVLLPVAGVPLIGRQLKGPAIALMLYGLAIVFPAVLCFTNGFDIADGNDAIPAGVGFGMMALSFLLLGLAGLLMRGGWHMLAVESYGAALLASFLGQPIGLWGLFVLSRPDVKSAFPVASQFRSEPRFSRFAIAGAVWALFGLLAIVPILFFIGLNRVWNGTALPTDVIQWEPPLVFSIFMGALLAIGSGAPIGTTIYGGIAIGHIKRSGGKIIGLPLAVADVLFFPLLVLGGLIAALVAQVVFAMAPHPNAAAVTFAGAFGVLVALVACFFVGRAVWRAIVGHSDSARRGSPDPAVTSTEGLRSSKPQETFGQSGG